MRRFLTSKLMNEMYAIQCTAVHDLQLYSFVRMAIRGVYETSEDFGSRKALQGYVDMLRELVAARIKKEEP